METIFWLVVMFFVSRRWLKKNPQKAAALRNALHPSSRTPHTQHTPTPNNTNNDLGDRVKRAVVSPFALHHLIIGVIAIGFGLAVLLPTLRIAITRNDSDPLALMLFGVVGVAALWFGRKRVLSGLAFFGLTQNQQIDRPTLTYPKTPTPLAASTTQRHALTAHKKTEKQFQEL